MAESLCAHRNKILRLRKASLSTAFGHESKRDVFSISQVVMRQNPKTRQHETADFDGAKDMPKVGMKSTIVTLLVVPQTKQKQRAMLRYRDRKNIKNSAKGVAEEGVRGKERNLRREISC